MEAHFHEVLSLADENQFFEATAIQMEERWSVKLVLSAQTHPDHRTYLFSGVLLAVASDHYTHVAEERVLAEEVVAAGMTPMFSPHGLSPVEGHLVADMVEDIALVLAAPGNDEQGR